MTWTGLPPQTLAIAAIAGTAGLILLFLLRPRPRVLAVPSHVLWNKVLPRRMNPLIKELIALLIQVLVLLAILGALGRPQREVEGPPVVEEGGVARPRDRVAVVDCSASMAALEPDGAQRMEWAREGVGRMVAGLAEGERMAVVIAGPAPIVAVPLTDDLQRLGLAVRMLRVQPARADLAGALDGATALLGGEGEPAEIRVFSDAVAPDPEVAEDCSVVWEPVGSPRPNVAVTAFDVRASEGLPARLEAFVQLSSYAAHDAQVTVSLETATRVLGRATYALPAGGTMERIYQFAPPAEDRVEVALREIVFLAAEGDEAGEGEPSTGAVVDNLALDDHAYRFLPELRPARVLMVSRGNQYLEAALSLIPGLQLDTVAPPDFQRSRVASGGYDVVFYDSFAPADPPPVNSFYINPPTAVAGFSVKRRVEAPATSDWNLGHPLFANLVLRDLNVAVSGQFEPRRGDVRLIGTPTGPIALARDAGGVRQVAVGFDFADSDLPLRVAFPQLIFNTLLWMREGHATGPGPGRHEVARDPDWLEPAPGVTAIRVQRLVDTDQAPERRATVVPAGDGPVSLYYPGTGFFEVEGALDGRPVAVSMLDPQESDLRATPRRAEPAPLPPARQSEPAPEPVAPLWFWLGLAALVAMIGEFGVINR